MRPCPPEKTKSKRRASPEPSKKKEDNVEEEDEYFLNPFNDAPAPSKGSKRLPMDEERTTELRLLSTANLVADILKGSETIQKIIAVSGSVRARLNVS